MAKQLVHPQWVRRLNLFGPAVGGPGHVVSLDPDDLIATARRATGLSDFGAPDWEESFRRLLDSIERESHLHLVGRVITRAEILRVLGTRLRLEAHWKAHPEVLAEPIAQPLFVLGPPRSGTTILLELLALDPALRAPLSWETAHPLPLAAGADDRALRMELAEAEHELWSEIDPEFQTMHELRHDLPAECVHFTALDFAGPYWGMQYELPSFSAWRAQQPGLDARIYRGHRRFLQTLQHGCGRRRWLLKTPGHLATLPQLFAEYPDALVIHTHRDPVKFVGSVGNLMCTLRFMRSDRVDPLVQGQIGLHSFRFLLDNAIALRRSGAIPDARIVDSHYLDLMADPPAQLARLYERLGLAWPRGHEATLRAYLRDKPKAKFGAHQYRYADLGLDVATVRDAFAGYVKHYGVKEEPL